MLHAVAAQPSRRSAVSRVQAGRQACCCPQPPVPPMQQPVPAAHLFILPSPALPPTQVNIQHALFVPPDSTYMKLGASGEAPNLSWQHSLRSVWDSHAGGSGGSASSANGGARSCSSAAAAAGRAAVTLPPLPAVPSPGTAAGLATAAGTTRSAVLPSLAVTLDWLRRCVREAPSLRMQVLVTGSLYLVGDMLKHLQSDGSGSGAGNA